VDLAEASIPIQPPVLCIGVDVTWWGGSNVASDKSSRSECVASAVKTTSGWEKPRFTRLDLNDSFDAEADAHTPNSDANGEMLLARLENVIEAYHDVKNVVVALDAPLLARERGLPPRRKSQRAGEVERRECDRAWASKVSLSPRGWKGINIQPGAPLPPRIRAIVETLEQSGFCLYVEPAKPLRERVLIECFPNEVIWSAGVLGRCSSFTYPSMTAYKRMGKSKTVLPLTILESIVAHTIKPCLDVAGLSGGEWFDAFWQWLREDAAFVRGSEGITGKGFDDAIDSMLSLVAAAAFASGNAHVHQGNPDDGHIIGPGLARAESAE